MSDFISQYWEAIKRMTDEQYREANQAIRSNTFAPPAAGDSGGTPAQPASLNPYAQQTAACNSPTPAQQAAIQGMSTSPYPLLPPSLGYAPLLPNAALQQPQHLRHLATIPPQVLVLPREKPVVGEIIGHRAWRYMFGKLVSMSASTDWLPGVPMSDVTQFGVKIADHGSAGVWAFKTPYEVAREFGHNAVFGTVWMWGTVIEHERGYRAQYATIRSLDWAGLDINLEALRAAYRLT